MLKAYFRANPRMAGLFLLLMSLGFGKFFILDVISKAQAHSADVSISMKAVVLGIAFFLFGMILTILGPIGSALLNPAPGTRKIPPLGWAIAISVFVASFGFYFWFQHYIEAFGYKF
jgi:hypothetical protein